MAEDIDKLLQDIKDLNDMSTLEAPLPGMQVIEDKVIKITVGKLAAAMKANPTHPLAQSYVKAVHCNVDAIIFVSRVDLQCLLENKEVERVYDEKENLTRKKIGRSLGSMPGKIKAPSKKKVSAISPSLLPGEADTPSST